jgi:hypothetical protein
VAQPMHGVGDLAAQIDRYCLAVNNPGAHVYVPTSARLCLRAYVCVPMSARQYPLPISPDHALARRRNFL